jgi:hypothetical protein
LEAVLPGGAAAAVGVLMEKAIAELRPLLLLLLVVVVLLPLLPVLLLPIPLSLPLLLLVVPIALLLLVLLVLVKYDVARGLRWCGATECGSVIGAILNLGTGPMI